MDDKSSQLKWLFGESCLNEKSGVNMMTRDLACSEGLTRPCNQDEVIAIGVRFRSLVKRII